MRSLMLIFWMDDCGALIATEWLFVATILVLGLITGLVSVRQAVVTEIVTIADVLNSLNQSHGHAGRSNAHASTASSGFQEVSSSIPNADVASETSSTTRGDPCD